MVLPHINMSKLIKWHTLNMYSLLYVSQTSIKWIFFKKKSLRCRDQNLKSKPLDVPPIVPTCLCQTLPLFGVLLLLLEYSTCTRAEQVLFKLSPAVRLPVCPPSPDTMGLVSGSSLMQIHPSNSPALPWRLLQGPLRFSLVYR